MGDSIQVEGGTQADYVKQARSRGEDDGFRKIRLIITWTIGILLFIAVIAYASVRGTLAYKHTPAIQQNFQYRPSVNFPAVTICPLTSPAIITNVECVKETAGMDIGDCSSTIRQVIGVIQGISHYCLTYNDPRDGSAPLSSQNLNDFMEIQANIDSSSILEGEAVGAIILIHDQGTQPILLEESTFVANVGQKTAAFISVNEIHFINGTVYRDYLAVSSSSDTKENANLAYGSIAAIEFSYTQQGVNINQEYYVYTPDNWIGEVGGFACLLWFLHWAVTNIILLIVRKVRR